MTTAHSLITSILSGDLSTRAQGFMIVLPKGYLLQDIMEEALKDAYGSSQHPDIRRLAPEGAGDMIKVDMVRDAQGFLVSTPSAAKMKTLVLYRTDRMNESAANALLKPLEEPTKHTRIILLTDNPAALPSTIRSRCAVYSIQPDPDLAIAELHAQARISETSLGKNKPADLLSMADGNPTLAVDIAKFKLADWLKKVEAWLGDTEPNPPLPTLTGKTAAPLQTVALTLQAMMARASRGDLTLKGWNMDRVLRASWGGIEWMSDITRAGIDAKTRMHTVLVDLRSA